MDKPGRRPVYLPAHTTKEFGFDGVLGEAIFGYPGPVASGVNLNHYIDSPPFRVRPPTTLRATMVTLDPLAAINFQLVLVASGPACDMAAHRATIEIL